MPATLENTQLSLNKSVRHQAERRWKSHCLQIDTEHSTPNNDMFVCSDFIAILKLATTKEGNCSATNHAAFCAACITRFEES